MQAKLLIQFLLVIFLVNAQLGFGKDWLGNSNVKVVKSLTSHFNNYPLSGNSKIETFVNSGKFSVSRRKGRLSYKIIKHLQNYDSVRFLIADFSDGPTAGVGCVHRQKINGPNTRFTHRLHFVLVSKKYILVSYQTGTRGVSNVIDFFELGSTITLNRYKANKRIANLSDLKKFLKTEHNKQTIYCQ